jgi:hypothetical protein
MKKQELTPQQKLVIAKINAMKKYYQEIEEVGPVKSESVDFRDFKEEEEIDFKKELQKIA